MSKYDIIFLGSSPEALTAAAYSARAGRRVLVLEPSADIGGAASTKQFADGFSADVGLMSGRLHCQIVEDLNLGKHGLEVIERSTTSSLLPDGRSFTLKSDREDSEITVSNLREPSGKLNNFVRLLGLAKDFIRTAYDITPTSHPSVESDHGQLAALVSKLQGYGDRNMTEVIRVLVMPVRDLLDEWFESAELKGLFCSPAARALNRGPFAGGTTFNLLHHLAIGDGFFRATARGGVGAIGQALAGAARAYGAEVRANVGSLKIVVKDGAAIGAQVGNSEVIEATAIVSDYDARCTFQKLVSPTELEPEFNRAVRQLHYNGSVARINFALKELPQFEGLSEDALRGTLVYAPTVSHIERASDSLKYGEVSKDPYLEVTIPTIADPSLAPSGKHVMSVWFQYAPYKAAKLDPKKLSEAALSRLGEFAPGLKKLVLHTDVVTPQDFEARYQLTEGHLYGGEMTLAQVFSLRPVPGYAQYRGPIENLFLCGAATHPGGGISGLSGRNLARELEKDPVFSATTACGA